MPTIGFPRAKSGPTPWVQLITTFFCCRFRWLSSFRTSLHRSWVKRTFPKRRVTIRGPDFFAYFCTMGLAPFETITNLRHYMIFFGECRDWQADLQLILDHLFFFRNSVPACGLRFELIIDMMGLVFFQPWELKTGYMT